MRTQSLRPVAVALLLVLVAVAAPFGAGTVAAQQNQTDAQPADLAIDEPTHTDGDVQERTENGTRLYIAQGEELEIVPTNVDAENITGYGMDTDAGSFTYDETFGQYVLKADGNQGTFALYWTVDEQRTEGNETVTETVRYEASVRVDGGTNGTYLSGGEHETLKEQAELGKETESVVSDLKDRWLPFFDSSGTPAEVIERAGTLAATVGNPINIFRSGYIGFHTFVVLSLGGTLAALQYLGFFALVVRKLRGEKHEFEVAESQEGDLAKRQLEVDEKERLNKLSNMDWFDIFEDDHIARAFRDHLGETVLDGWIRLNSVILPENLVRDRVQAMGKAGYVAVATTEQPATDGGEDETDEDAPDPIVTSIDLVREAELEADALDETEHVVSLPDPGSDAVCDLETVIDVLEWDNDELASFDFDDASLSGDRLETNAETLDLEQLIEQLDVQMQHFEDEQQYGEYLHEFVATVREHPFTDDDGSPDDMRYLFNNLLQASQLLEDRYGYPLAEYQANAFESAVSNYDRSAKAAAYSKEVEQGAI